MTPLVVLHLLLSWLQVPSWGGVIGMEKQYFVDQVRMSKTDLLEI